MFAGGLPSNRMPLAARHVSSLEYEPLRKLLMSQVVVAPMVAVQRGLRFVSWAPSRNLSVPFHQVECPGFAPVVAATESFFGLTGSVTSRIAASPLLETATSPGATSRTSCPLVVPAFVAQLPTETGAAGLAMSMMLPLEPYRYRQSLMQVIVCCPRPGTSAIWTGAALFVTSYTRRWLLPPPTRVAPVSLKTRILPFVGRSSFSNRCGSGVWVGGAEVSTMKDV